MTIVIASKQGRLCRAHILCRHTFGEALSALLRRTGTARQLTWGHDNNIGSNKDHDDNNDQRLSPARPGQVRRLSLGS